MCFTLWGFVTSGTCNLCCAVLCGAMGISSSIILMLITACSDFDTCVQVKVNGGDRQPRREGENSSAIVADIMAGWQACVSKICAVLRKWHSTNKWLKVSLWNVCIVTNADLFLKSLCQQKIRPEDFFNLWCDLLISLGKYPLISLRWRLQFSVMAACHSLIPSTIIITFEHANKSKMHTLVPRYKHGVHSPNKHIAIRDFSKIQLWQSDTHLCGCRCTRCWGHSSSCGDGRATRWKSLGPTSRWRQCQLWKLAASPHLRSETACPSAHWYPSSGLKSLTGKSTEMIKQTLYAHVTKSIEVKERTGFSVFKMMHKHC